MNREGCARPVVPFAWIGALPSQPMVVLAAKLRELAQILNAGNNLTLRAVVLQPTHASADTQGFPPVQDLAPDAHEPRGYSRGYPQCGVMRWLRGHSPRARPQVRAPQVRAPQCASCVRRLVRRGFSHCVGNRTRT